MYTSLVKFHCTVLYSTSRKSLNKRLASGCVLGLRPPPHWTWFSQAFVCVRLRASARVCVHLRASACICARLRASACVYVSIYTSASACVRLRPPASVRVRVRASAFVCVQTIKSTDASRHKWISASGRVFCSRTFGMYCSCTLLSTAHL